MAVGDWSTVALCAEADVVARYGRATSLLAAGEDVDDFCADAKEEIGEELDARLREQRLNITISDASELKDLISNPEVFKKAAIAYTLKLLFEKNVFEEGDFHSAQREIYMAEYKKMFNRGFALMEFDKDASGEIEDEEVATGPESTKFYRV